MSAQLDTPLARRVRGRAFRELASYTDGQVMTRDSMAHCLAYAVQISVPEALYLVEDYLRAREGY